MNVSKMQAYIDNVYNLRKIRDFSCMIGDYKIYKQAKIAHASEMLRDFNLAKKMPYPEISVPLFSKAGFNMIKIAFYELFRKKTSDEKNLAKLFKIEKLERKFFDKTV